MTPSAKMESTLQNFSLLHGRSITTTKITIYYTGSISLKAASACFD